MTCAREDHTATLQARPRATLRIVLGINAVMFLVIVAAGGLALTGAAWPDLLVALALVVLLLRSALRVIASARAELRR